MPVKTSPYRFGSLETLEPRMLLSINPTGVEQLTLELINRFREDPQADLSRMVSSFASPARSDDPDIDLALRFFRVNGFTLAQQFSSVSAAPPLAFNAALNDAAKDHSRLLRTNDSQSHQEPGEPSLGARVTNAGYNNWTNLGENVYSFADSLWHGHAGFVIDWGNTASGIQDPPGHRNTLLNSVYKEVGIGIVRDTDPNTSVGEYIITQDFGNRSSLNQAYLLGVVYDDTDNDEFYSVGEGFNNLTVTARGLDGQGTFQTQTFSSGGYQINLPNGRYEVTFADARLNETVVQNVTLNGDNVKLDVEQPDAVPAQVQVQIGNKTDPAAVGFGLRHVNGQTFRRTFTLTNTGGDTLKLRNFRTQGSNNKQFDYILNLTDANGDPTSLTGTNLEPGQSATLVATFDPSRTGRRDADLVFATNSQGRWSPTKIRFKGEGELAGNTVATAFNLGTLVDNTPARATDSVSNLDRSDLYRFTLDQTRNVKAVLSRLDGNADLRVFDSGLNLLGQSRNIGLFNERVDLLLGPGTYYIQVVRPQTTFNARFNLRVVASP